MKANEFFKKHGWNDTKVMIESPFGLGEYEYLWDDLKRLVESHELVAIHGFEKSKEIVVNAPSDDHFYSWTLGGSGVRDKTVNIGELRKAIADVESCMEVSSESN
ncbi:hypothetical protein [Acinetobacter indicus]|uniref:hypothetical protein n=1 Tax=Acinetobacter indicus TaxID=756892 RepID=UPI000948E97A|nr:hypothetical protein [Acinetobacter indicus]